MNKRMLQTLNDLECSLQNAVAAGHEDKTTDTDWIIEAIRQRTEYLAASVCKTVNNCSEIEAVVRLFLQWMQEGAIVRVIGAGRARLVAAIPANRLAHGGARVFMQDDIIPMPHTLSGGGIIAASASGETKSVLDILGVIREEAPHITVVGIAKADAQEFRNMCHHFIGVEEDTTRPNPLSALADMGEYVIAEVLDALVVAAGKLGGFDDRKWRLGHENIGHKTGPYDARIMRVNLLFNERY